MVSKQMWAVVRRVKRGDDWIMHFTIRQTRREAIRQYVSIYDDKDKGRMYWRRERDRDDVECVRVTVTVNEPTTTQEGE